MLKTYEVKIMEYKQDYLDYMINNLEYNCKSSKRHRDVETMEFENHTLEWDHDSGEHPVITVYRKRPGPKVKKKSFWQKFKEILRIIAE